MIKPVQLEMSLKGQLFEMMADFAVEPFERIMLNLKQTLVKLLQTDEVMIYVYNDWLQKFEQTGNQKQQTLFPLQIKEEQLLYTLSTKETFYNNNILHINDHGHQCFVVPLANLQKRNGFIVLFFPLQSLITNQHIAILQKEIDVFWPILSQHEENCRVYRQKDYLINYTAKLLNAFNQTDILTTVISSLQLRYPDFTFYIWLSQDHPTDGKLPIKSLKYSDHVTKRVSMQAFITGKVQIENRLDEKTTCFYVPLKGSQGVYGILQMFISNQMNLPGNEKLFLSEFADITGQTMENMILYQHANDLVSDLKLINEVTQKLNANLQLTEIIGVVKRQIKDTCQPEHIGFVFENQHTNDDIILEGSTSFFKGNIGKTFAKYMMDWLMKSGEPIFSGDFKEKCFDKRFRSIIVIPMRQKDMVHGAVIIVDKDSYTFSLENFKLIQTLIEHSALAISNAILNQKLEQAAIKDYLTQLYSRNHLDKQMQLNLKNDNKGVLLLFDLDDFKLVNDTYGHYTGDKVLKQVAAIIHDHARDCDIPARWGGEELALYLSNVDEEKGREVAYHIREQVVEITNPMITVSCGVAVWKKEHQNQSVHDLFILADQALYKAKKRGKDCVVVTVGNTIDKEISK